MRFSGFPRGSFFLLKRVFSQRQGGGEERASCKNEGSSTFFSFGRGREGGQTLFPRIHRRPSGPPPLPTQSSLITGIDRSLSPLHLAFFPPSPFLSPPRASLGIGESGEEKKERLALSSRESAKRVPSCDLHTRPLRPAFANAGALFTPVAVHNSVPERRCNADEPTERLGIRREERITSSSLTEPKLSGIFVHLSHARREERNAFQPNVCDAFNEVTAKSHGARLVVFATSGKCSTSAESKP